MGKLTNGIVTVFGVKEERFTAINPVKSPHPLLPGDTPLFGQTEYVNGVWFWGSQEYNFSIQRLEQGVFLDQTPRTGCKPW